MQTHFTAEQLKDPAMAASEEILRACVHCGFCTATCPTFVTLGDELDSPRGRIYQIKDMLENERQPGKEVVSHIDRCLSCLSCMTTCPSGVNYMHLVDHARSYIKDNFKRPAMDAYFRKLLAFVIPNPTVFRLSLIGATMARPFKAMLPDLFKGLLDMAPPAIEPPSWTDRAQVIPAQGKKKARVAILSGCAQKVLNTAINESTIRLLTRHGVEVVIAKHGCCGALVHHMGDEPASHAQAAKNIDAWYAHTREGGGEGIDAVVINASGCGTTVKDYGFMFRNDPAYAEKAAKISELTKDVTEFLADLGLAGVVGDAHKGIRIAYHSACSMQHGQKITALPKELLKTAGYQVLEVPESHLCCGSAGTYNILQPDIANRLKERKVANIESTEPDIIAAGNIGCMVQIGGGTQIPVVHTAELLDWATGGEKPRVLQG